MKKTTATLRATAAGAIALLALTSCAANEDGGNTGGDNNEGSSASLSGTLDGSGASSQGTAQQAWISGFQTINGDVTVNYDPVGSGGGRKAFQEGGAAFAGSDAAFDAEELEGDFAMCAADSSIVEFPAYISPIAIIFNIEGVDQLKLDADTLAGIFAGEITNWNDPAIAEHNEGVELPDLAITAVHRSDESGTTENFTEYLSAAAPDTWTVGAIETWPTEFGGEAGAQTSGVVDAVTIGNGTIGYADASKAGDLGTVEIKVGDEYVPYSPEAAANIVTASPLAEGRGEHDLAIELDRTSTADGVYPIVLVSYLIGCETYEDAANAELVKAYFNYIVSAEGQAEAEKTAGNAPLSDELREMIQPVIDAIS